ncbi:hypothetical protein NEOLEDRAFT_1128256 [Neolentinus lepideus HHB14362 ss-1]|uniref:DUF6533 domain-containing protein n=1 Tax=Neolentinus lepideus HHB14362 ss-1 TaxID=1314782 RepID=A0A165VCR5_9AGAM|nr:hypothetical protein NEOLEDRAFT_1128256 [Neolentinus lepideus HHB14362 ss-1]
MLRNHPPRAPDESISSFQLEDTIALRNTRYTCLASLVVLIYDIILTFDAELQYVWTMLKPPHTYVSIVFITNRYGNIVLLALLNAQFTGLWFLDGSTFCEAFTVITNLLILIALASINVAVPIRRAWGAWVGSHQFKTTKYLAAISTIYFVASAALLLYGSLAQRVRIVVHGTCVNLLPRWLWAFWLPSIILNSIAFSLSFVKLHDHVKNSNASYIVRTAYSDGMLYYVISVALDTWNILYWALGTSIYRHTLSLTLTLAIMNILSQRLVVRLRASDALDCTIDHEAGSYSNELEIATGSRPVSPLVFEEVLSKQPRTAPLSTKMCRYPTSRSRARLSHISEEIEMTVRSENSVARLSVGDIGRMSVYADHPLPAQKVRQSSLPTGN